MVQTDPCIKWSQFQSICSTNNPATDYHSISSTFTVYLTQTGDRATSSASDTSGTACTVGVLLLTTHTHGNPLKYSWKLYTSISLNGLDRIMTEPQLTAADC